MNLRILKFGDHLVQFLHFTYNENQGGNVNCSRSRQGHQETTSCSLHIKAIMHSGKGWGGVSLGEGWHDPHGVHTQNGIHFAKFTIIQGMALAFQTLKLIFTFQHRIEDLSLRGAITLIKPTDLR